MGKDDNFAFFFFEKWLLLVRIHTIRAVIITTTTTTTTTTTSHATTASKFCKHLHHVRQLRVPVRHMCCHGVVTAGKCQGTNDQGADAMF